MWYGSEETDFGVYYGRYSLSTHTLTKTPNIINTTSPTPAALYVNNGTHKGNFNISETNRLGIYDNTNSHWLIMEESDGTQKLGKNGTDISTLLTTANKTSSVTSGSSNVITSGGVYTALSGKVPISTSEDDYTSNYFQRREYSSDLNYCLNSGYYGTNTTTKNLPDTSTKYGTCIVINLGNKGNLSTAWITQFWKSTLISGNWWYRQNINYTASGWSEWRVLITGTHDGNNLSIRADGPSETMLALCADNGSFTYGTSNAGYKPFTASSFVTGGGSSKLIKTNIEDMTTDEALKLLQLNPVSFNYKEGWGTGNANQNNFGLIAEEVLPLIPEAMSIPDGYKEEDFDETKPAYENKVLGVDYTKFIPHLIKLCQIQQEKIKELEERISALEK